MSRRVLAEKTYTIQWTVGVPTGPDGALVKGTKASPLSLWRDAEITWTNNSSKDLVEIRISTATENSHGSATLYLTNASDSDKSPISIRGNNGPKFKLSWNDVNELLSVGNTSLVVHIAGVVGDTFIKAGKGVMITSIRNLALMSKMSGTLEDPLDHNVAFHFPGGRSLYADRSVLRRESSYFSTMFDSGFRESGGEEAEPIPRAYLFENSDTEAEVEDGEETGEVEGAEESRVGSTTRRSSLRSSKKRKLSASASWDKTDITSVYVADVYAHILLSDFDADGYCY